MEQVAVKPNVTVIVIAVALTLLLATGPFQNSSLSIPESSKQTPESVVQSENFDNLTNATLTPQPIANNTISPDPPKPKSIDIKNNYVTSYNPAVEQPSVEPKVTLNESFLFSAIKALGINGGQIVLENDLTILDQDIFIPSNITLAGANPEITIFLVGKQLGVAQNSINVAVKDLTIDSTALGERYVFVIRENAMNIQLDNVRFRNYNYTGNSGVLFVMGKHISLNSLTFNNVTNKPILISGSNVSVRNCYSNDNSLLPLITVVGGLSDITLVGNTALNRPLLSANYGNTSRNILIENNTVLFPNGTYGLLIEGGMGDFIQAPHENVTVRGNFVTASPGAWNAIAIYGLTRNTIVSNNTIDMSLSGHNGIGISSGVNVTVSGNIVYGSTELTEGGIEVESNPEHNRRVGFSENITVTGNTVYNSTWGIYVRVMLPNDINWNGTVLLSKNIVIESNNIFDTKIGVNLLQGESITVKNNNIASNTIPFFIDRAMVSNYTVIGNLGFSDIN